MWKLEKTLVHYVWGARGVIFHLLHVWVNSKQTGEKLEDYEAALSPGLQETIRVYTTTSAAFPLQVK